MNHSFPHRMIAVPARILLALFTDPLATVAIVVFWAALALTFWVSWLLIVRIEQWIARHVADHALDREYADLCDAYRLDEPADMSGAEHLPGVTRLGPVTPQPVRHALKRRGAQAVRIYRRRMRHTMTSSDRRSR